MTPLDIAAFAFACIAGAVVQSTSSFGFAPVAIGLLGVFGVAIRDAVVLVTVLVVPNIAVALWRVRHEVRLGRVVWLLAGVPLGTPLGIYLLAFGPEWLLRALLGAVLIGAALEPFLRGGDGSPRPEHRLAAFVAGVASGALGAALSTGGPPIVLYFHRQHLGKEAMKAAVTLAFVGTVLWRLGVYVAQAPVTGQPLLTAELALRGLAFWPAVAAGSLAGERLFARLSPAAFRRVVAAMLVLCGAYQVGKAAGAW